MRQNRLNAFIFGYYHVSTVLPILIVTPAYLVGAIPLGVLMQAAFAFQKVEGAFAFGNQYAKIAEWKALMDRVAQFEAAMGVVDRTDASGASARRRDRRQVRTCRSRISCCGSQTAKRSPRCRTSSLRRRSGFW